MKSLLVITITMLLSTQVVASNNSLRAGGKALGKLGRILAIPTLGWALLTIPLHQAAAQGQPEEALTAVNADDPAYRHGGMLLRASVPPAEDAESGTEYAFHLAFIGINAEGNSYLVGRERQSGRNVGEKVAAASNISLHAWDGVVDDGLTVTAIDSFKDTTGDDYYNIVLLEVEGLNLAEKYPPLQLDAGFPYAEKRDLEVLTYRLRYSPVLNEEELEQDSYTLRWLKCNSVPQANLAIINAGFTTCGIIDKTLSNGAFLIHDGKLVALQSLSSPTRRDEDDKPLVWLAIDVADGAVEFSHELTENVTAVDPAGKLATTWAVIKTQQW